MTIRFSGSIKKDQMLSLLLGVERKAKVCYLPGDVECFGRKGERHYLIEPNEIQNGYVTMYARKQVLRFRRILIPLSDASPSLDLDWFEQTQSWIVVLNDITPAQLLLGVLNRRDDNFAYRVLHALKQAEVE